jgi:glutamate formiminotransferase
MSDLFEAVPNVSEGRDPLIIQACAQAISAHAKLAHQTSDAAHHRSVFSYFGDAEAVAAASLALARVAVSRIDLRLHRGLHPRIGALDVLPFVPIGGTPISAAVALAHRVGEALWEELGVPSFFYGEAARTEERRILSDVRRGEFELLAERFAAMPPDI